MCVCVCAVLSRFLLFLFSCSFFVCGEWGVEEEQWQTAINTLLHTFTSTTGCSLNSRISETGMRLMSKFQVLLLRSCRLFLKLATTPSCAFLDHPRRTRETPPETREEQCQYKRSVDTIHRRQALLQQCNQTKPKRKNFKQKTKQKTAQVFQLQSRIPTRKNPTQFTAEPEV